MKTMLVIGDYANNKAKRHSIEYPVEKYVKYRLSNVAIYKENKKKLLNSILENKEIKLEDAERKSIEEEVKKIDETRDIDYFLDLCEEEDCEVDTSRGLALSTRNPKAKYQDVLECQSVFFKYKNYQSRVFSKPFKMKNGRESFVVQKDDIDWEEVLNKESKRELYGRAWEIGVNNAEPQTPEEKLIKNDLYKLEGYLKRFGGKEEYVNHYTCFWTYAIITEDGEYHCMDDEPNPNDWKVNFYERFIKPLDGDKKISVYDILEY